MNYDLTKLAIKQQELDNYIKESKNLNEDPLTYWTDKVIALNVEVNELINELRFFKWWSEKPASAKEVILDEFVDGIHFSLSLANNVGVKEFLFGMDDMKRPIRIIYFDITSKLVELERNQDPKLIKSIIFNLLEIAWYLGYSMEDIQEAYDIKNKVNYERQNTGY